jgi:hypothetical protein
MSKTVITDYTTNTSSVKIYTLQIEVHSSSTNVHTVCYDIDYAWKTKWQLTQHNSNVGYIKKTTITKQNN